MAATAAPRLPQTVEVVFQNPAGYRDLGLRPLRVWFLALVAELAPGTGSVGVLFGSDRRLAELNQRFRAKAGPTDVLSFPGDNDDGPFGRHLGDIAISVPTARRQAVTNGHDLTRELRVLLLHGVLHCLGYDHETDDGTMDRMEARLRRAWLDRDG